MGFVANGRYVLAPAGVEDAATYVDLQIDCLGETYADLADEGFAARHRADRANLLAEFVENVSAPGARAWLAYEVPGWTPAGGLSCAVGARIDWDLPVGLGLSRPGPLAWEANMPVPPLAEGTRELTQLYTRASTHGTGLGQALFDAVLEPGEPAYLWVIRGNERGIRFYERSGFTVEGSWFPCGGAWAAPAEVAATLPADRLISTGRMLREVTPL